jgi:hypothetical protein
VFFLLDFEPIRWDVTLESAGGFEEICSHFMIWTGVSCTDTFQARILGFRTSG